MYSNGRHVTGCLLALLALARRPTNGIQERTKTLNAILEQPRWQVNFEQVHAINGDSFVSLDDVLSLNSQRGGLVVTDENEHEMVNLISNIFSCKCCKIVVELFELLESMGDHCRTVASHDDLPKTSVVDCANKFVNLFAVYNNVGLHVLSAIGYLYRLYPDAAFDSREVYKALTSIALHYTHATISDHDSTIVVDVLLGKTQRLALNRLRLFTINTCRMDGKCAIVDVRKQVKACSGQDPYFVDCLGAAFNFYAQKTIDLYHKALGFPRHISSEFVATKVDLNVIRYALRKQYFGNEYVTQIDWYGLTMTVDDAIDDVYSKGDVIGFAGIQLALHSAVADAFYEKSMIVIDACRKYPGSCDCAYWDRYQQALRRFGLIGFVPVIAQSVKTLTNCFSDPVNGSGELLLDAMELAKSEQLFPKILSSPSSASTCNEPAALFVHLRRLEEYVVEIESVSESMTNTARRHFGTWDIRDQALFRLLNVQRSLVNESIAAVVPETACSLSNDLKEFFDLAEISAHHASQNTNKYHLFLSKIIEWMDEKLPAVVDTIIHDLNSHPRLENADVRRVLALTRLWLNRCNSDRLMNYNESSKISADKCSRLNAFMSNSLEKYMIANCDANRPDRHSSFFSFWNIVRSFRPFGTGFDFAYSKMSDTFTKIQKSVDQNALDPMASDPMSVGNCVVDLAVLTLKPLVEITAENDNPLSIISQLQCEWDGSKKTLKSIREQVVSDANAMSFLKYQQLVLNAITSVVLSTIFSILQADVTAINDVVIKNKIIKSIETFEETVFPLSKIDCPEEVFSLCRSVFENYPNYEYKVKYLVNKINNKLTEYRTSMPENVFPAPPKEENNNMTEYLSERANFLDSYVFHLRVYSFDFSCISQFETN